MKITFFGAAGEVTGSANYLETDDGSILIDCGMFQGGRNQIKKNKPLEQPRFNKLDAVLITHAHLDHTGRLPLLVKLGYRGPIYATNATLELTELVLQDSARIQEYDTQRQNRKNQRAGLPMVEPLYKPDDVEQTLSLFRPVRYDEKVPITPGISARWAEAGHLLGSASIKVSIEENGTSKSVVFSGDLGPKYKPLIRSVQTFNQADAVVMESTYGDRTHKSLIDSNEEAIDLIHRTAELKGKILIPSFALGRTQELLYGLAAAVNNGRIPKFSVFVDSPMAIRATEIYRNHPYLFDDESLAMVKSGQLREDLSQVVASNTAEQSIALNTMSGPIMIIAGSGMCTGGRILHHLRHNLWRPETAVIFVGYQAQGSLGRRIVNGADEVRIFGETIAINAEVATINGYSGHADQSGLVDWFDALSISKPQLILNHGEEKSRRALANIFKQRYAVEASLPKFGETISL